MIFGFFKKKKVLFIELNSHLAHASIVENKKSKATLLERVSSPNPFYKDGVIRDQNAFSQSIHILLSKLPSQDWGTVIIGIDSAYLRYVKLSYSNFSDDLTDTLRSLKSGGGGSKLVYSQEAGSEIALITMPTLMLSRIYNGLELAGLPATRFVPTECFKALNYERQNSVLGQQTLILNLGFRSTSITVVKDNFLIDHKSWNLGLENLALAVSKKCEVEIDYAKVMLKDIYMFENDEREWTSYGNKHFNKKETASIIQVCCKAFLKKILTRDHVNSDRALLFGGAADIPGFDLLAQQFIDNTVAIKGSNYLSCEQFLFI